MFRKVILPLLLIMSVSLTVGCAEMQEEVVEPEVTINVVESDVTVEEAAPLTTEEEIDAWVENSKELFLSQSRELDGKQYFLITYGRKDDRGYSVEIADTEVLEDRVVVNVDFQQPEPEEEADDVESFPYALESIESTGLPVEFVASGAESFIPQLLGIDFIYPIVAQSNGIKVFSPAPGSIITRRLTVDGIANVYEGNFQYRLCDSEGKVLAVGYNTAAMGDWKFFSFDIEIDKNLQVTSDLTLALFTESTKDGSIQDEVLIDLQLNK